MKRRRFAAATYDVAALARGTGEDEDHLGAPRRAAGDEVIAGAGKAVVLAGIEVMSLVVGRTSRGGGNEADRCEDSEELHGSD
jgi:hypothetical protein